MLGFTLVEILTVMGVISVLLAVGVPAFKGLNGTGIRRSAVNKVMGVLDQARAVAISEGKNAYVVFASPVAPLDQTKWGRACAIYVEDGTFTIKQRSAWIYLPTGTSFKVIPTQPDGTATISIMNRPLSVSFPVTVPGQTSPATLQLPYIKFDNTGTSDEQDPNYARILIFLGAVNSPTSEIMTQNTASATDGQKVLLDEVDINVCTGRAKYITDVSENLTLQATPTPSSSP